LWHHYAALVTLRVKTVAIPHGWGWQSHVEEIVRLEVECSMSSNAVPVPPRAAAPEGGVIESQDSELTRTNTGEALKKAPQSATRARQRSIPDMTAKRSLIFSTRLRFSPQTQKIRDTALDRIVEQAFLLTHTDRGLTQEELEASLSSVLDGHLALTATDVRNAIKRLQTASRLVGTTPFGPYRYHLSPAVCDELFGAAQASDAQLASITKKIFRHVNAQVYEQAFLDLLCNIFSQLGESYVRYLHEEMSREDLLGLPNIGRAIQEMQQRHQHLDADVFREGVIAFFRDNDPEYDALKWRLAQNSYIARALGMDDSSGLLSENIFADAIFYLDTNIIIPALEPLAQYHQSVQLLRRACQYLKIDVRTCQISIDELRRVVQMHLELISKVASEIPDALATKVRGVFFALYRQELEASGAVDLGTLFANFEQPGTRLRALYDIEVVDDHTFDDLQTADATQEFAQQIRTTSEARRPNRPKTRTAALHDATILRWVASEREKSERKVWLVTLDNLLPALMETTQPDGTSRTVAITMDALLQWLSPVAIQNADDEQQFAMVFAEAVRSLLLPQDTLFDLQDFAVLAQLELDCKLLPPQDVEGCLRLIKTQAPNLNLSHAADREQLACEVQKYFTSTGRKYKQDLAEREAAHERNLRAAAEQLQKEKEQRERELREQNAAHEETLARIAAEHQQTTDALNTQLQERQKALATAEEQHNQAAAAAKKAELQRSAKARFLWSMVFFLGMIIIAIPLNLKLSKAATDAEKLLNAKELYLLIIAIWAIAVPCFMGTRERLRELAWPIKRLLKAEESDK
jgi:hypothetical protein